MDGEVGNRRVVIYRHPPPASPPHPMTSRCLTPHRRQPIPTRARFWFTTLVNSLLLWHLSLQPGFSLPLSPGDRVKVTIPEGELFSGVYEVNADGSIRIAHVGDIPVQGLELAALETQIKQRLIQQGVFRADFVNVSVQTVDWAPIQVFVSGATFQPGRVLINGNKTDSNSPASSADVVTGKDPLERYLSSALRAAGGITPLANLKQIRLQRHGQESVIDLSGVMTGDLTQDVPLVAGDRIIVPTAPKFQNDLVRPSQLTPPGIKVFTSNLTVPANSNAAASIRDAVSFPYGSRFSQAVIAANCVGGTQITNARRKAILVRTDRLVGETVVLERSVETLVRKSLDDTINPFLMPNDGVACYDSNVTNIRDAFGTLANILTPINLLRVIFMP